jgi:sec-independent protein translocase protein TatA
MFGMPSGAEWLIVLLLVLIVFGAGKLPQVGRQLGSAISEFKDTVSPKDDDDDEKPTTASSEKTEPENG